MDSAQAAISCFIFHRDTRKTIRSTLLPEDIQDEFDVHVYKSCLDLDSEHEDFDYILVMQSLKSRDQWNAAEFARRYSEPCSGALARYYAEDAHKEASRRAVEAELLKLAMPESRELSIAELLSRINAVQEDATRKLAKPYRESEEVTQMVVQYRERYDRAMRRESMTDFVLPWKGMNEMLGGGLYRGEVTLVAARPGDGKTHTGLNIFDHFRRTKKVWYVSVDMQRELLMDRLIAKNIEQSHVRVKSAMLEMDEMDRMDAFLDEMEAGDSIVMFRSTLMLHELEAMVYEGKPDLLMVDYVQNVDAEGGKNMDMRERVGKVSSGLRRLATSLHIPVVAMAQLKRPSNDSKDRRPTYNDLKEAGKMEEDAANIWLLYQSREEKQNSTAQLEILIDKNRNGSVGTMGMLHNKPLCRISEKGSEIKDMEGYAPEFEAWG